jgi:hypothetical protein
LAKINDDQATPSSQEFKRLNAKKSASPRRGGKSHDSDSDFFRTHKMLDKKSAMLDKHSGRLRESESRDRDQQSSGRGQGASFTMLH